MSDRINLLIRSTSTDTSEEDSDYDETIASYLSGSDSSSSRSSASGDSDDSTTDIDTDIGTSFATSKSYTDVEDHTDGEDLSLVNTNTGTYTTNGEEDGDDESSVGSASTYSVNSTFTEATNPTSRTRSNTPSVASTSSRAADDENVDPNETSGITATTTSTTRDMAIDDGPSALDISTGGSAVPSLSHVSTSSVSPRRNRVPGGAAAKLMLLGPKGSTESDEKDGEEAQIQAVQSVESVKVDEKVVNERIVKEMEEAKNEYQKGSPSRRSSLTPYCIQTHDIQQEQKQDDASEVASDACSSSAPSFLNRNEIFHKTAAAAVAALLTPRAGSIGASSSDLFSVGSCAGVTSPRSYVSNDPNAASASKAGTDHQGSNLSQTLLTPKAEEVLREMKNKMHDPNSTLTDLLTAIASPDSCSLESLNDLGYMVRRKNACGALQVLTANQKNRVRICWTAGVLPALTSVLADSMGPVKLEEVFPDRRIRAEYVAARNRAISSLMNLAMPPKNRIAVFHTPELIQAVLHVIETDDEGSARRGCCGILAFLAKSTDNKLLLFQVPGLLETVRRVIAPVAPQVDTSADVPLTPKKLYPWQEEEDVDTESDTSSAVESIGSDSYDNTESEGRRNRRSRRKRSTSSNSEREKDEKSLSSHQGNHDDPQCPNVSRDVAGYDDTVDENHRGARQNMFALMCQLVKEKDNAYLLGREVEFLETLVAITKFQESESHTFAIQIIAHLSRHRQNKQLAFKPKSLVQALVDTAQSPSDEARIYAIYAMQNLSQEKSCRQELAIAENLIIVLCDRCRNAPKDEERLASICTLKNLCDEPANLIPMTNTPGCVSTLMHIAHGGLHDDGSAQVNEMMQYRACDALATLSHWLRKISTSGYALETQNPRSGRGSLPKGQLFVPTLREISWNQWS